MHYTAWLTNDRSCLDQPNCDVTVIRDEVTGYTHDADGNETSEWASTGSSVFHALTTVDATDGDIEDAINQAEHLLLGAGWDIVGTWAATDTSYTVTVTPKA